MRLISIEWLTVILITVLMRASTQTLAGCFRAAHHCPSFIISVLLNYSEYGDKAYDITFSFHDVE